MKKIISIILSAVLLTACQSVPQNVKDRNEELDSMNQAYVTQIADETSPVSNTEDQSVQSDTGDIDYIRSHLKEDASKKYGTITTRHASAGEAKSMPTYKVEITGNPDCDLTKIAKRLYGNNYDVSNKGYYEYIPFDKDKTEPVQGAVRPDRPVIKYNAPESFFYDINKICFDDKTDMTLSSYTYSDGSCWGSQTGSVAVGDDYWKDQQSPTPKATYFPMYDDISSVSYKMKSGTEWKLTDAVKYVEIFWNEYLSANDPVKYTYKVYRVDVIALSENYGYNFMLVSRDENGGYYDADSYNIFLLEQDKVYDNKRFFTAANQSVFCIEKEELTRYVKGFSIKPIEKSSENKKLLTLGGAMKKLEQKLASNINLSFETAELKYVVTCDKYPNKDYDGAVAYSVNYCNKTCELYIRPCWCFKSTNGFFDCWNTSVNYYVDAVTGDVHIIGLGF